MVVEAEVEADILNTRLAGEILKPGLDETISLVCSGGPTISRTRLVRTMLPSKRRFLFIILITLSVCGSVGWGST